jgi:hypothetical protein
VQDSSRTFEKVTADIACSANGTDGMSDDLLGNARRQAEKAEPSTRAAALLRIARVEAVSNATQARASLLEALEIIRNLPNSDLDLHFDEARTVAAAVDPTLLAEIPATRLGGREDHTAFSIIQAMLAYGHVTAALDYVLSHQGSTYFPISMVGNVLHHLDPNIPEVAARRVTLLRAAVEAWRRRAFGIHHHAQDHFLRLFGIYWKEFPPGEALLVTRAIAARAIEEPDTATSSSYADEVRFTSSRQHTLFLVLHLLRHFDPALAQSLIDSHEQLSAAAARYPNGLQTIQEEAEAEAVRRKAEGANCGGGFVFAGDPRDLPRQRRLAEATRNGDFGPSVEDALEKYREDTSQETRNYAPKEYWPSTAACRTLFYQAGKSLGPEAARFLDQIPDEDLRLFASIELAAALAGAPGSSISSRKQPNPPGSTANRDGRIVSFRSSRASRTGPFEGSTMRSPDGRLIRCPKCSFEPAMDTRWGCKCGHVWNTFWTSGLCPACRFQWEVTGCPHCREVSEHKAWYVAQP